MALTAELMENSTLKPDFPGSKCSATMYQSRRRASLPNWRITPLLVALCGSQLILAGHQFQHDAWSLIDVCAVCVQLEHYDDPALMSDLPILDQPLPGPIAAPASARPARDTEGSRNIRAPPALI